MRLLDLVPASLKAYAGMAVAIAAAAAIGGAALWHQHAEHAALQAADAAGAARVQAKFDAYRGQVERQALGEAAKRQSAQAAIDKDQQENLNEAQRIAARDRVRLAAGAHGADAADRRLQQRLEAAHAAAGGAVPGGASAGGCSPAEPGPEARLLAAARRSLRQLARDADAELVDVDERLRLCVAQYDVVRSRVNALSAP